MKKQFIIFLSLLFLSVCAFGCGKDESETASIPDTIVVEAAPAAEEVPASEPEEPVTEEPASEEPAPETEEPEAEEVSYPYWSELHDYNLDQELLTSDGEIKNLSIQLGNNPDELFVTWFSKSSSKGKVKFETDGLFSSISAKAATEPSVSVPGYYRNSALITGLKSNTTYTYYVKNGSSTSPVYTYETGDLESTDFTFTIAADSEIGLGDPEVLPKHRSIWRVVLNRMRTQIPESSFILSLGDQVADPGSSEHYDYFLDNSVLYSTPLMPVMGNHDVGTGFFGDHFSLPNLSSAGTSEGRDGNYWFVKGNVLFMVLNNLSPASSDEHEQFVAETIAKNPDAKWRVIASHYSPVTMVERYMGARESVRASYAYMAELYDIDLFLGGHDHIYTRSWFIDENGNPYPDQQLESEFYNPEYPIYTIFNASTDALLRHPDDDYPWSAVTVQNDVPQLAKAHVTENSFTITAYDADTWTEIDSFTIYKD